MHKPQAKHATHAHFPPLHGEGQGWVKHHPPATTLAEATPTCELFAAQVSAHNAPRQKTGAYSPIHLTVAIAVTYPDWRAALAVGLIEPAVQTVAFLIHDRIWSRIDAKQSVSD